MDGRSPEFDDQKVAAARAAVRLIRPGMVVALGSGSTVNRLIDVLAESLPEASFVAASPATASAAAGRGLSLAALGELAAPQLAIDGADQIDPTGWLIKGGGAAHTREKILAAASQRFVVIASANKLVGRLRPPVPIEVVAFGFETTLAALGHAQRREDTPVSPDGGVIADYLGPIDCPAELARRLDQQPGIVAHGLFPPTMVDLVIVARGDGKNLLFRPNRQVGSRVEELPPDSLA
jgi:ribose 5-phosphate isomerase A